MNEWFSTSTIALLIDEKDSLHGEWLVGLVEGGFSPDHDALRGGGDPRSQQLVDLIYCIVFMD